VSAGGGTRVAVRIFHVSDMHFGKPSDAALVAAIEAHIRDDRYDVVAVSGDLTQRARAWEFRRARTFLEFAETVSRVIAVPGNHDVKWWRSPLHLIGQDAIHSAWQRHLGREREPVLRVSGATLVGLNTAQGVSLRTLTRRPRDISIIGDLRRAQVERAHGEFTASPAGDARVIVMHHNPVKGELSQRHGLKDTRRILGAFAQIGVDLVLCGHDHQEAIHFVEHTRRGTVISTAGTVSNRSRGGRPSSVNAITITAMDITVRTLIWSSRRHELVEGASRTFARHDDE
jgi:3',5'-cyclic AMP phosphodiesterase CpdA